MSSPLAASFALLLFPGYFFYHYAVGRGMISPVAGGWFGTIALAGLVALAPFAVRSCFRIRGRAARLVSLFVLLVLYASAWAGAQYLLGSGSAQDRTALEGTGRLIVFWGVLFLLGYFLDFSRTWFQRGLLLCFAAMAALTLLNIDPARVMFHVRQPQVTDHLASYQGFARSVAVTAILLLAVNRRLTAQIGIIGVGAITLFLVGARSEFYGFLLVGGVWTSLTFLRRDLSKKIIVLLAVLLFATIGLLTVGLRGSRQLEVFNLAAASSWQVRQELLEEGVAAIVVSPLVGQYGGQISTHSFGTYIHNGLSAWRQFGLIGFLLYGGIVVASAMLAMKAVLLQRRRDSKWIAALYMNLMCAALIVVAKSVFWEVPALAWGLTAGALLQDRWAKVDQTMCDPIPRSW